ncbi:MAG: TonB-dependent receptor [Acidobacteriales bacterium]|nr:TonB-dependent receptor [Terriglobales bacterium]
MRTLGTLGSLLFLLAGVVYAQTGSGSIQGTVKDATGAVVPQAKVRVVQTQTTRQYDTVTNEVGFYLVPSVQLGPYQITVEAAGMETWKGDLTLVAGQVAEVNPVLKVGATATAVTVAGDVTPLVTTTAPTLATVVERARIEQLPLNGRFIQDLLYMTTPGFESGSVPRVFGLRYAVELLQDGAILENRQWQQLPARPPGLDTIDEFRAETSNSSAKMNRPGTVILTTRAGTNDVHGSVFETARSSAIGVARARQDFYLKPPHLVRNEFGASLGGPVYLPKLYNGRNRTFFFFAYEGFRQRTASTRSVTMPTPAMRQGDFSGLIDGTGRLSALYDPLTTDANWRRQPFPNNQIPINRRSPLAAYLYSITPLPTHPGVNPLVDANWYGLGFNNRNQTTITTRVDHRLSDRDQLFFRYSHNPSYQVNTTALGSGSTTSSPTTLDGKANARIDRGENDSGVASWTHTFSPTFFSETIFSVQRDHRGILPIAPEDIATQLGLSNPFKGLGFPRMQQTGFGMDYDSAVNLNIDFSRLYNLDQNFTKVHGRHELQFGGRWRYESLDILADQQQTMGTVFFNSLATSLYDPGSGSAYGAVPLTGHNAANLFLGMATYNARYFPSFFYLRTGENAAYFQDNFKATSRLTLNFGLRYEYTRAAKDRDNTVLGFDPKTHAIVMGRSLDDLVKLNHAHPAIAKAYADLGVKYETPSQAGLPDNFIYPNKWDFGPRLGFAYRMGSLSRPIVLRGGYAIYAFPESLRLITCETRAIVPTTATFANDPNSAQQSPDGLPNYLLRSVPKVIAGVNSKDTLDLATVTGITRGTGTVYYLDPHQPTARAHEWNITVEREILANTSVKLSYAGTHGVRLAQYYSYNDAANSYIWFTTTGEPLPTGEFANVARRNFDKQVFGTIWQYQKTGWSNDSSFVAEVQHRYSKGYAFQMFYTMSNALRVGGDGWRDDILPATNLYLPGAVPEDPEARNRLLFYRRDTDIPKHRVNWNWIVDLPFGQGKAWGRNSRGFVNSLIGGWQIAGNGQLVSRYFALPTSMWGPLGKSEVYGKKFPIQDCRSGVCYDGWLYYNGYIPANRINSFDPRTGKPNGVMGVPDSYKPFQTPLIPTPKDGGSPNDPNFQFYESNTVFVPLKNGTLQRTSLDTNLHPMRNQYLLGPMVWSMNASAFKSIRFREQMFLRFNIDFFNVFNMPGTRLPDSTTGIITNQLSQNSPRVLQLTGRLSW